MYLKVTTKIPIGELSVDGGMITTHSIEVWHGWEPDKFAEAGLPMPTSFDSDGDEDNPTVRIGKARVECLHVGLADNLGIDLSEICDADSSLWDQIFSAFLTNGDAGPGFYQDDETLEDCCTGDVMLIDDIEIVPEYLGRGVEMAIASRIIEIVGNKCDLAVYHLGDAHDLFEHLKPLGFKAQTEGEFAFLNLLYQHPRVLDEDQDSEHRSLCRFTAKRVKE